MKRSFALALLILIGSIGICHASGLRPDSPDSSTRQIDNIPYFQDFDEFQIPALPAEWTSLINPTGTGASVQTTNSTASSQPNCVELYNGSSLAGSVLLSAPLLGNQINLQQCVIRFKARSNNPGTVLKLGFLSNPNNANTYIHLNDLSLSQNFEQYSFTLTSYTGSGRFVCFRHGLQSNGQSIFIDDFELIANSGIDLSTQITNVVGTPCVSSPTIVLVGVQNYGIAVDGNYLVKLFVDGVLASEMQGSPIPPNQSYQITFEWIPTSTGTHILSAQVLIEGDFNAVNDISSNFSVTVHPANSYATCMVGSGNETSLVPLMASYSSSLFETIFFEQEVPLSGAIQGLAFRYNFATNFNNLPIKIWLGITDQDNLNQNWIPASQLTLVYNDVFSISPGMGILELAFDQPFPYTGGNLVMLIHRAYSTNSNNSNNLFYVQDSQQNRSRKYGTTGTVDPQNPPNTSGMVISQFPQTIFLFQPGSDVSELSIYPPVLAFNDQHLGLERSKIIRISNTGSMAIAIGQITLSGAACFTLQNIPALPQLLLPMHTMELELTYLPVDAGSHEAEITLTDNQNRFVHTIPVSATCVDAYIHSLPFFDGFDTAVLPELPGFWQKLVHSSAPGAYIKTMSNTSYSPPNSVAFYANLDNNAILLLAAPPVTPDIYLTDLRVKFWARRYNVVCDVAVGLMDDPMDAGSFVPFQIIPLNAIWTRNVVSLEGVMSNGRYLAFRLLGSTLSGMFIDAVSIETLPAHDPVATVISGTSVSQAGSNLSHTILVHNYGSETVTGYMVQIISGDQVLAQSAGLPIPPGETVPNILSWTSQQTGTLTLNGRAVLTGNPESICDLTPPYSIYLHPSDQIMHVVGEGDVLARYPLDFYWRSSIYQTIYQEQELDFTGIVDSITFYSEFGFTPTISLDLKLWLGSTTLTHLENGWEPISEHDQVFEDEEVWISPGLSPMTLICNPPYIYDGENVLLLLQRMRSPYFYVANEKFRCQTATEFRSRMSYSDNIEYNPYLLPTPQAMQLSDIYPQTTFHYRDLHPDFGSLTGSVVNAEGSPIPNAEIRFHRASYTAITNDNGVYTLPNVYNGDYYVSCHRAGHESQTSLVRISQNMQTIQNFVLTNTSETDEHIPALDATCIKGVYPNPFNPTAEIEISIKDAGRVLIQVYNTRGQRVRTLFDEITSKGTHSIHFNGKDDAGKELANGIYFVKLSSAKQNSIRKITLLK